MELPLKAIGSLETLPSYQLKARKHNNAIIYPLAKTIHDANRKLESRVAAQTLRSNARRVSNLRPRKLRIKAARRRRQPKAAPKG